MSNNRSNDKTVRIAEGEYAGLWCTVYDTTQGGKYLHVTVDVPVGDDGSTTRKNITLLRDEVVAYVPSSISVTEIDQSSVVYATEEAHPIMFFCGHARGRLITSHYRSADPHYKSSVWYARTPGMVVPGGITLAQLNELNLFRKDVSDSWQPNRRAVDSFDARDIGQVDRHPLFVVRMDHTLASHLDTLSIKVTCDLHQWVESTTCGVIDTTGYRAFALDAVNNPFNEHDGKIALTVYGATEPTIGYFDLNASVNEHDPIPTSYQTRSRVIVDTASRS